MAVGKDTYASLAVPLNGDFEMKQRTAATDVMTMTGASGQTGDFIVARNSSNVEQFYVKPDGKIYSKPATTAPTTGLVRGEMFVCLDGDVPSIGICYSTGAQLCRYILSTTLSFHNT